MALAIGFFGRPVFDGIRDFLHYEEPECLKGGEVCVGKPIPRSGFPEYIGGVTSLACPDALRDEDRFIYPPDLFSRHCPTPNYVARFSDGSLQTMIVFKDGRVTKIERRTTTAWDL